MRCGCCGKELGDFTNDVAYQLPDVVWAIAEAVRMNAARYTTDLCQYGERYFLRGIALVPINDSEIHFGWGLWVEVKQTDFDKYLAVYAGDGTSEPPISGQLANTPPGYFDAGQVEVDVFFGSIKDRPRIVLRACAHQLFLEQANGISIERVHEINGYMVLIACPAAANE